MAKKKAKPTVWQALNEPVVEVGEGFARGVFVTALAVLFMVWVAPYWGTAQNSHVAGGSYNSPLLIRPDLAALPSQVAFFRMVTDGSSGMVAGIQTRETPVWYYAARDLPGAVTDAFATAATQVLDISEPAAEVREFYGPGLEAVGDAWLELMADPY